MSGDSLYILAVLGVNVALSEWLVRRTWLRHLGSALLVIVLTALAANTGLIPTYSESIPVYSGIFAHVAPLAIFLLLLQVDLRGILRAGGPMLALFALGATGTVLGVLAGMKLVGGSEAFGELHHALGGMFVGTYIGGSINYNAIALEYDVVRHGALYAGAAAVDSAMTAAWMAITVIAPRWLSRQGQADEGPTASVEIEHDTETVNPFDLAVLLALGAFSVWLSGQLGDRLGIPSVLVLTTVALLLAQTDWIRGMRGARLTGWLAVMLFLAVIGALCDVGALRQIGPLAGKLLLFVTTILAIHGTLVFVGGALLRCDPATAAVASQANIGGSTSALALARSLGRGDLVLPGILVGALGNGVGTYLGFMVAAWLR